MSERTNEKAQDQSKNSNGRRGKPTGRPGGEGEGSAAGPPAAAELIALRILPTALRCREIGEGLVTYRKTLSGVVPGQRLVVGVRRRWRFRRTDMIGGSLLHAGFSLRALARAGYALPTRGPASSPELSCPGFSDERLREALMELEDDDWLAARCLLLELLEDEPGSLIAHAALGGIHATLNQGVAAAAHHTAAIRLGLAALMRPPASSEDQNSEDEVSAEAPPRLNPNAPVDRCLLQALVGRADLLSAAGRAEEAAADLRRALALEPGDACGAGRTLARLGSGAGHRR